MKRFRRVRDLVVGLTVGAIVSTSLLGFADMQGIQAFFNDIKIRINGNVVDVGNDKPFIYNGRTYVPARYVAEGLGATVKWNESDNTVEIDSKNNTVVSLDSKENETTSEIVTPINENLALNKSYTKSEQPDGLYFDSGKETTDGVLAGAYSDRKSYGYRTPVPSSKTISITLDLENIQYVSQVRVHKWEDEEFHYNPNTITIHTSKDGVNFESQGQVSTSTGIWYQCDFAKTMARYVKVTYDKKNPGLEASDWLFIDEIEVYNKDNGIQKEEIFTPQLTTDSTSSNMSSITNLESKKLELFALSLSLDYSYCLVNSAYLSNLSKKNIITYITNVANKDFENLSSDADSIEEELKLINLYIGRSEKIRDALYNPMYLSIKIPEIANYAEKTRIVRSAYEALSDAWYFAQDYRKNGLIGNYNAAVSNIANFKDLAKSAIMDEAIISYWAISKKIKDIAES